MATLRFATAGKQRDLLLAAALALIVIFGCFGRTVVQGKQISKLPILAMNDYFFNSQARFTYNRTQFDPSLYQFHIPFQIYAADEMRKGRVPIWNNCFSCGFPTVAEPQYCTFSPFRAIFSASNSYLYNLGIVVKAVIATVSTFLLARLLNASTGASILAALSYGLGPFILRELELPNEMEFFPLVALIFLVLANKNTFAAKVWLGIIAAVFLTAMHPEFFFLEMAFASVFSFAARSAIREMGRDLAPEKHQWLQSPRLCFFNLFAAASIALCLTAPLLLSFVELVSVSSSYKFAEYVIQKPSYDTLLIGLTTPLYKGGSPFIGVVALSLAIYAACFGGKGTRPVVFLLCFMFFFMCTPGPLAPLAKIRPFSFVPPRYLMAPFLLTLTILSAWGADLCFKTAAGKEWKKISALFVILAGIAATPQLTKNIIPNLPGFDGSMPSAAAAGADIVSGIFALCIVPAAIASAVLIKQPFFKKTAFIVLIVGANIYSINGCTRNALPATFPFSFRSSPTIERIKSEGARLSAVGLNCFSPNISLAYNVEDYRGTGPIMPYWISKFNQICYSKLPQHEPLNSSYYVPHLIDCASVKYVLAGFPLVSLKARPLPLKPIPVLGSSPHMVLDVIALSGGEYCLTPDGELFTRLHWQGKNYAMRNLATQLDLVDEDGKTVRLGPRINLSRFQALDGVQSISVKIPPQAQKSGQNLYLILRMVLALNEGFVPMNKTALPARAGGIELLKIDRATPRTTIANPLKLVAEDENELLLYENKGALPQAYITNQVAYANSYDDACSRLKADEFVPQATTIIESKEQLPSGSPSMPPKAVPFQRPDPNHVIVKTDSPSQCFLILTDTFYNGWQVHIDGIPAKIERANLRFRAVKIPPGSHSVVFEYRPYSFYVGLLIASLCAVALFIRGFYIRLKSLKHEQVVA